MVVGYSRPYLRRYSPRIHTGQAVTTSPRGMAQVWPSVVLTLDQAMSVHALRVFGIWSNHLLIALIAPLGWNCGTCMPAITSIGSLEASSSVICSTRPWRGMRCVTTRTPVCSSM